MYTIESSQFSQKVEKVDDKIALSSEFVQAAKSFPFLANARVRKREAGYKRASWLCTFHLRSQGFGQRNCRGRAAILSLSVLVLGIRQPDVRGRQLQHGVDEAGVLGVAVVIHLGAHKVVLPLQPVGVVGGRGRVAPCPPAVESQRCPQDVLLRLGALPHRDHPVHACRWRHIHDKHILVSFRLTFTFLLEETKLQFGQTLNSKF